MSEIEQKVQQLFSYAEYDYSFFDNIVEILKWFDKVEVKIETDGVKRQETLLFYKGKLRVEEWKAVKTTVDIYYMATVYTYTVEDGVEYLETTIVWNDGVFYKMMYFYGTK